MKVSEKRVETRWGDPGASEPDVTFYFFMSYTLGIETNPFTDSFVRPFKSEKCKKKIDFLKVTRCKSPLIKFRNQILTL